MDDASCPASTVERPLPHGFSRKTKAWPASTLKADILREWSGQRETAVKQREKGQGQCTQERNPSIADAAPTMGAFLPQDIPSENKVATLSAAPAPMTEADDNNNDTCAERNDGTFDRSEATVCFILLDGRNIMCARPGGGCSGGVRNENMRHLRTAYEWFRTHRSACELRIDLYGAREEQRKADEQLRDILHHVAAKFEPILLKIRDSLNGRKAISRGAE